jgi:hypothetical protein
VPAGSRRLRIEAAGCTPWEQVVTINPGQTTNLGMIRLTCQGQP